MYLCKQSSDSYFDNTNAQSFVQILDCERLYSVSEFMLFIEVDVQIVE